ncbi:MAG: HlyD family efflux transporter periplasmic adaptor subunit [Candidatus Marinimicrobia bacterium]|nr:HlyD family efflux transporter periplasmic adaptor subunit [Candidatus Neomarinimicrobiota bacterium]
MKKTLISLIVAAAILLFSFLGSNVLGSQKESMKRMHHGDDDIRQVRSLEVNNQDMQVDIPVTGRVDAIDRFEIFAEVTGTLMESPVPFKEGNHFKKGDILLKIDDREARLNLQAQKSNLLNSITQLLPDLKLDFPASYANWESYLKTFDLDRPLRELPANVSDKEKYFVAARGIYNSFYSIRSLEVRLEKYTIRAPYEGVITQSNITVGTLVRIGQNLGTFISTEAFEIEVALSPVELDFVSVGNHAHFLSSDISGKWSGKVTRISEQIDAGTQTIKVFIIITEDHLKSGMYLTGYIQSNSIKNVMELPRNLITDDRTVFVIQEDTLKSVSVQIVKRMEKSMLVTGLTDGTILLNEIIVSAIDGMKVTTSTQGDAK